MGMGALFLAVQAAALPTGGLRRYVRGRVAAATTPLQQTKDLYFTQRLDHFDGSVNGTFQQRYFLNATYFTEDGPVFLCVGGEGPALDASVLYHSVHCSDATELAARAGALLVALSVPWP